MSGDVDRLETATLKTSITIEKGIAPPLLERVVEMHAAYYSANYGFGQVFENKIAREMTEFLSRLEKPQNALWYASHEGRIAGSVSIDGQDLGNGVAHLRWFIVDDNARGTGIGKRLLAAAMDFVDQQMFAETHLWTFKGLDAARRLYELHGFVFEKEQAGEQWGTRVLEQKFVRPAQ